MIFNQHSDLEGRHAILSPSYYHWLNYDRRKLEARLRSVRAATRGTDLHDLAHEAIRLGIRLDSSHEALATYVDDCIFYRMRTEQPLLYSPNCFGHADALGFSDGVLRIFDLKTGIGATSFKQLEIYTAIFCLEYGVDPETIEIITRIYQNHEVREHIPTIEGILMIMDRIVHHDNLLEELKGVDQ